MKIPECDYYNESFCIYLAKDKRYSHLGKCEVVGAYSGQLENLVEFCMIRLHLNRLKKYEEENE